MNWQREVERFTPDLRLLQFTGQGREKDPAHFEGYDLVITTYGIILRDIESWQARNTVREYLQAHLLWALQHAGAMIPLAFHGGTALRFLYATARYSEDLDFALEREKERYDFHAYLRAIQRELTAEGYAVGRFWKPVWIPNLLKRENLERLLVSQGPAGAAA